MSEPGPGVRDAEAVARQLRAVYGNEAAITYMVRQDAEIARLRGLLGRYGWHEDDCPAVADSADGCSCGWDEVQTELDEWVPPHAS